MTTGVDLNIQKRQVSESNLLGKEEALVNNYYGPSEQTGKSSPRTTTEKNIQLEETLLGTVI